MLRTYVAVPLLQRHLAAERPLSRQIYEYLAVKLLPRPGGVPTGYRAPVACRAESALEACSCICCGRFYWFDC